MKQKYLFSFVLAMTLISSPAYAGKWVEGTGKTPEEAQQNAINKKVKIKIFGKERLVSPGACFSGKTRYKGKRGDLYVFEAKFHNHKGSCGK